MNKVSEITDVDAVITWVNGNDPNWQKKINEFSETKINFENKKNSVRYNSIGEINIAITSIIKFASFVRTIYLVTDDQTPEGFSDLVELANRHHTNLVIVDHKVVFRGYESYLPCFNSCSIGSTLFRIPNLADHFIIFNDDTFLMRETSVSDFFINGEPIIRGQWQEFNENRKLRNLYRKVLSGLGKPLKEKSTSFKKFQQTSAKLAGTKKYVRRFHTPVCVRRSTLEKFVDNNKEVYENNIKHRFRNTDQFIVSSLSEHLEIYQNTYHFRNNAQLTYFRSYKNVNLTKLKLYLFTLNKSKLFMTFQSLELADDKTLNYIFKWINLRLNLS